MSRVPVVGPHDPEEVYADLLQRLPGFEPGWSVGSGPGAALLRAYARFLSTLGDRLDRAPDKSRLAFLDLLGVSLLPAKPARAPVVFSLPPGGGDTRAPAGSQVAATVADRVEPLVFETEADTGLCAARLVEVATVWPGQDSWADHGAAARSGSPFTLFDPLSPVPHELYLAHRTLLALSGAVTVEVTLELSQVAPAPMDMVWEYWDGETWRAFKTFVPVATAINSDSVDGTLGLTRSGTVRLVADCSKSEPRIVAGIESHWIRGRLAAVLPPNRAGARPAVDRVRLRSVVAPSMGVIRLAGPDGGRDQQIWLSSSGLSGQGIDLSDAFAVLSDPTEPDKTYPTQSLASGSAQWDGIEYHDYTVQVTVPGYTTLVQTITPVAGASMYFLVTDFSGLALDKAVNDGLPVDLTTTFFPFGQNPQTGSVFAISLAEAMSKPLATVSLLSVAASTGRLTSAPTGVTVTDLVPKVVGEYFDGRGWSDLGIAESTVLGLFTADWQKLITFTVPADVALTELAGEEAPWIRFRITNQTFGATLTTNWEDSGGAHHDFRVVEPRPPVLGSLRGGYVYRSPQVVPEACLAYNDFSYIDHTAAARDRGSAFAPFVPVRDMTPTLYCGFDRRLPADVVSMYLDVAETEGLISGPGLVWEHWSGTEWVAVTVRDETANLALPGMVAVASPGAVPPPLVSVLTASLTTAELVDEVAASSFRAGDLVTVFTDTASETVTVAEINGPTVMFTTPLSQEYSRAFLTIAGLPRFGTPRDAWLRARLRIDGEPRQAELGGLFLNAAWVAQVQTVRGEVLGGGTGQPGQVVTCRQTPVLPGQVLEIRELSGARADVEQEILRAEVLAAGLGDDALRLVTDPRTGRTTEVWVRWIEQPNLHFSGPGDRHYVIERSQGRIVFGDDRHGRIPPAGTDNVRMASYLSGGGAQGNVPAGAISQLLSGILATSVSNVRAAEGGADNETVDAVAARGSGLVRSRVQAMTPADYEALAQEASPAVAVARALPCTDAAGRPAPGWVRIAIVPHSFDPRPMPSFGLRREVENYLRARCPASMGGQVTVVSPQYHPVGASATVVPVDLDQGGVVIAAVSSALTAFLHPLGGGPDGRGWPFGRDVHLSDVARLIELIPGVDHLEAVELLADGIPRGDVVAVPAERIVVCGPLVLRLAGGES
ncbi:baseplate J/gp47 family protein [Kribbella ginsengisoli]